jgi:hypothetical protein
VAKLTFNQTPLADVQTQDDISLLSESLTGRFVRYSLSGDGQQIRRGRVLQVMNALILFESPNEVLAVAIERLAWLEVHADDN